MVRFSKEYRARRSGTFEGSRARCMVVDRCTDLVVVGRYNRRWLQLQEERVSKGVESQPAACRGGRAHPLGGSQRAKVASASRRPERVSHQPTSTRRVTLLRFRTAVVCSPIGIVAELKTRGGEFVGRCCNADPSRETNHSSRCATKDRASRHARSCTRGALREVIRHLARLFELSLSLLASSEESPFRASA